VFGFGRYRYNLLRLWVDYDASRKQFRDPALYRSAPPLQRG
jgi:hypothetical protein